MSNLGLQAHVEFLAVRNAELLEAYTKGTPRTVTLRQRSDAGFGVFMSGAMLDTGHPDPDNKGTPLSGSISTVLTGLSWICVGIHSRRVLPCPVCA